MTTPPTIVEAYFAVTSNLKSIEPFANAIKQCRKYWDDAHERYPLTQDLRYPVVFCLKEGDTVEKKVEGIMKSECLIVPVWLALDNASIEEINMALAGKKEIRPCQHALEGDNPDTFAKLVEWGIQDPKDSAWEMDFKVLLPHRDDDN